MRTVLTGEQIADYSDERGNRIVGSPQVLGRSNVEFLGENCHVHFAGTARIAGNISFRRDNSTVTIGGGSSFRGQMSLGLGCTISMGEKIYCGTNLYMTTAEGADITLGNDLLISENCVIRADDSHPLYDGFTGERINPARSITVEDHVWIGQEVFLMPGSFVGKGSVLGARAMVTRGNPIPPHSLAIGTPARVQREGVHWVRKHLQTSRDVDESITPIFAEP